MVDVVLDASAILAVIFDEPGADHVAEHLPGALVSTVNITEVATRLLAFEMPLATVETVIDTLQLSIYTYDYAQAMATAHLRPATRSAGLSLGDRACLSLARAQQATALTSDQAWQSIAEDSGVTVMCIR